LHVCLLTSSFPRFPGDLAGRFVHDLANHLLAHDLQVTVLAPHAPGLPVREEMDGLQVYRFRYFVPSRYERLAYGSGIPTNVRRSLLARLQLLPFAWAQYVVLGRFVQQEGIDLINSHWLVSQGLAGALVRHQYGVPHVCTVHSAGVRVLQRLTFGRRVGAFVARHTDHFFVVSSFIGECLSALLDTPVKASVLPMGVDTLLFSVHPRDLAGRVRMGLGGGPLLLFVGRLVEKKGVQYLIEAMPEVVHQVPDVQLLIVGEGDLSYDLRALVRSQQMEKVVRFLGRADHDEIPAYLAMCDWLVVPSIVDAAGQTEGMPVVLLEALASGRPVVASRVAGIPDLVVDGENGFLARPGDPVDLARQIVLAICEPDWQRFSDAARRAAESHDWTCVADQYAGIFHCLAGHAPVGD
jgi:glycosyltransferase involved in cell wall biosynthesis